MADCQSLIIIDWQIPDVLYSPTSADQHPHRNHRCKEKQHSNSDHFEQTVHRDPEPLPTPDENQRAPANIPWPANNSRALKIHCVEEE